MQMRIKNLLQANAYLIAIGLTAFIAYLSLDSFSEINMPIDNFDKVFHSLAYFFLALSWFFAVEKSHSIFKYRIVVAFLVIIFGIIIEVLQSSLTTYRTADYYDIMANSFGILIAMVLFNRLLRLYNTI
ncbi:MAG: VanZ family protein [Candidatus Azotimanducaceae bacterium]|jgi:VanZ family protein